MGIRRKQDLGVFLPQRGWDEGQFPYTTCSGWGYKTGCEIFVRRDTDESDFIGSAMWPFQVAMIWERNRSATTRGAYEHLRSVGNVVRAFGIPHEKYWPHGDASAAKDPLDDPQMRVYAAKHRLEHEDIDNVNPGDILYALSIGLPVLIEHRLWKNWGLNTASGGPMQNGLILPDPVDPRSGRKFEALTGRHIVCLTGYDLANPYIDFKQSLHGGWGSEGGRPGFGRIHLDMFAKGHVTEARVLTKLRRDSDV